MAKSEISLHINPSPVLSFAILFIGIAIFFLGISFLTKAPHNPVLITVSATGSVNAVPAQAVVYLLLNATGSTSTSAISNLSAASQSLNSTLMPFLNYNSSLIQTLSYSVYAPSRCKNYTTIYPYVPVYCIEPNATVFYVATEYIKVTLPDARGVNLALEQISGVPGLTISNVASELSTQQQASLDQQALALAMSNATSQAQIVAGTGKISLQNVTIENGYIYYPTYGVFSEKSAGSTNASFFPGTASASKTVLAVFRVR